MSLIDTIYIMKFEIEDEIWDKIGDPLEMA